MRSSERISKRTDSNVYFYYRRVPKAVQHLDRRGVIRISLSTTDEVEARVAARRLDRELEDLWAALAMGHDTTAAFERYEAAVSVAKMLGFSYRPVREIGAASIEEIVERVLAAKSRRNEPAVVEAILGGAPDPDVMVSDLWKVYHRHRAAELKGMSPRQLEKHRRSRERAMENVQAVLGNMALKDITRGDVRRYRDSWAERVAAGEITAETANRGFADVKGMISVVDEALQTEFSTPWRSMNIRRRGKNKEKKRTRPPYSSDFIQTKLLRPGVLNGLNLDARLIVYTMVETGLRLGEACNLRGHGIDVFIDAKIPYVEIEERDDREQKTAYSIRRVPLVGVSLWALRQAKHGFKRYFDKGDSASAVINKFLRENGLRPSPKHSVYSLRHSFQDRLLAAGAPDRLQTDLMGHEFDREVYGEGASMEQKLELLTRIKFQWDMATDTSG